MALISMKTVVKEYRAGNETIEALRGIDLEVEKGEFTAIAGPSGSGKTTLLNIAGCLDIPTSGQVTIESMQTTGMSAADLAEIRRMRLGFIFQSFNLIPVLTAEENVAFALHISGGTIGKKAKSKALDILGRVGLAGMEKRYPRELSGGQQQRVAIARALVRVPALVLADEPTANLDSATGDEILTVMKQLNRDLQVTFLLSTHDPMVMEHCGRLVQLHDGLVFSDGRQDQA